MLFKEYTDLEEFQLIRQLGSGYSADVGLYKHIETQELVAIKLYSIRNVSVRKATEDYNNELRILQTLSQNQNVVKLRGFGSIQIDHVSARATRKIQLPFLILDYIDGVSLNDESIFEKRREYCAQLLDIIRNIHSMNIYHRDLKLDNIIVSQNQVYLIDFGFAAQAPADRKLTEYQGTQPYVAPEVVDGAPYYGAPADVYSLGVIFKELNFEQPRMLVENPYHRITLNELIF